MVLMWYLIEKNKIRSRLILHWVLITAEMHTEGSQAQSVL